MTDWLQFPASLFTFSSIPLVILTPYPIFTANFTPGPIFYPLLSPILPQTPLQYDENLLSYSTSQTYFIDPTNVIEESHQQTVNVYQKFTTDTFKDNPNNGANTYIEANEYDPVEWYLKLPRDKFPTPNMIALDPNPIIDEFCKMPNIHRHLPWLLDLELGLSKYSITQPIPIYSVIFNSINCKNTPTAIHPGFGSCDINFKRVLLFYYDSVISAWYRGYMMSYCDISLENFQSWLLLPMQVFGMCWP